MLTKIKRCLCDVNYEKKCEDMQNMLYMSWLRSGAEEKMKLILLMDECQVPYQLVDGTLELI